jgi:hypothetical protein
VRRLREAFWAWGDIWLRSHWRVQRHCVTGRARLLDPAGKVVCSGEPEDCIARARALAPSAGRRRAAVVLHGLWDYPGVMRKLARALEAQGWAVANLGYPSLRLNVVAHAAAASLAARALAEDSGAEIDFVGYSLGGLVARTAMARAAAEGWRPGKLVLIGSPAQGSAFAKRFRDVPGYRTVTGACGPDVTPEGAAAVPPPVAKDVLVIAGGTGGRGFNPLLRGDNDGLIAVAETRLPGYETGFRLVRSIHKDLPAQPATIAACTGFLEG